MSMICFVLGHRFPDGPKLMADDRVGWICRRCGYTEET